MLSRIQTSLQMTGRLLRTTQTEVWRTRIRVQRVQTLIRKTWSLLWRIYAEVWKLQTSLQDNLEIDLEDLEFGKRGSEIGVEDSHRALRQNRKALLRQPRRGDGM
ncbi:MAG TPA: hypothetical protein VF173_18995 [Thermoanaerobaculia bacterium]|nr:hypothetical protein [Thermoanaerobaculia bacterium]